MPYPLISWFKDIGIQDRPSVGGKGASLGELIRAGIQVPTGFVVTTAAFERYLEETDRQGTIRASVEQLAAGDVTAITEASKTLRQRIIQTPMPADLQATITDSYRQLCGNRTNVPVAVRSSATSEDSAGHLSMDQG